MGETARKFTNVYVKNFGEELDDNSLREMFEKYGVVLSSKSMSDENGKSRGFGFVAFENPEDAEKVRKMYFFAPNFANQHERLEGQRKLMPRARSRDVMRASFLWSIFPVALLDKI